MAPRPFAFSLAIFFFAVTVATDSGRVRAAVEAEPGGAADQREFEPA